MIIKYLDYLSPRVTFYYQGNLSHTTIISGIISIVAIVFLIILSVYFSLDIIQRNNPNTFFFNSFIEDSGTYYFNKTSLFHFIKIIQNIRGNEIHEYFDFTTFNIIGAQAHIDNFINNNKRGGLKTFDHWVYGYCNKNNTEGLDDLIKFDFFEKSACVIKYFNCTEGKYYSIDEPNFAWPRIAHGTFNDLNKLYGLYVQKCSDDILYQILGDGYNCKNDSEIDYYFDSLKGGRIMHFYFVNNYINILDYHNPINKFIYRMETPLYKEQYSTNSININPVLVRTHNGLILDNLKDDVTYMLDRNDVYISERKGANMYMGYCFFLKNNNEYYERTYKRIQEVISSIGGINQAITIIAIYLNYLYNNYVVLSDTEMLLHSLIHTEKKNHRKKSIELRNLNNRIKETPKEKKINSNDIKKSSDYRKLGETIDNRAKKNKTENNVSYTNDQLNNKAGELTMDNGELGKRKNFEKMKTFKDYDRYKSEKSFCNYLCFFISCSKKKRFFKVYQDFRIKIISEEHLIRNHLNIYNLLKITEKKRHIRRNSYHLDDLMNLV